MLQLPAEFEQFHWMVDMVQNVDMGLVVIDRDFDVQVWNGFMTHHRAARAGHMMRSVSRSSSCSQRYQKSGFGLKTKPVYDLGCRSFITLATASIPV